jgi:hypothetical protein
VISSLSLAISLSLAKKIGCAADGEAFDISEAFDIQT